ncbi:hypothetical protein [Enterococcus casseliflavus]|uniref:hypothetical protein n=1 Tax=Enterococcus TaxID=1350 RepID=UPI00032EC368|nr:hypothetical protein [Enterococcus casseliflavus]EOH84869.1 hypothetical protein UAM_00534 [Enterococcus casseliflavus ATCC 49996]EOU10608.1 hypothetical protein I582_01121 [Enterococcus casseliflavus ATCC 49996]MBE9878565.1 hypothetical protein [Enterococcus casseliflavus]QQB84478.1 hypothetical protein I6H55_11185 [Enterococcus casseliflavus]
MKYHIKYFLFILLIPFINPRRLIWLYGSTKNVLVKSICIRRLKKWSISISSGAIISPSVKFPHPQNIVIGRGVVIEDEVVIYQGVTIGASNGTIVIHEDELNNYYPYIKKKATIYTNSVVAGGICIGEYSVIGANSFVNKDVPDKMIYAGNPARSILEI